MCGWRSRDVEIRCYVSFVKIEPINHHQRAWSVVVVNAESECCNGSTLDNARVMVSASSQPFSPRALLVQGRSKKDGTKMIESK